jgi:hypothetical protein
MKRTLPSAITLRGSSSDTNGAAGAFSSAISSQHPDCSSQCDEEQATLRSPGGGGCCNIPNLGLVPTSLCC